MLRRAEENYYKDRFNDAIDNPRKTRRLLNDLVNSKKTKGISEIKVGDSMIENPTEVAEHFNSHFCSVGAYLVLKITCSIRYLLSYMGQSSITPL